MKESFDGLMREMDEACELMRSFTLGRRGFTQQDGVGVIDRVRDLCVRMQEGLDSGKHGKETAQAVGAARGQILAARARLDLLRK